MQSDNIILTLFSSPATVFTTTEIAQLFPDVPHRNLLNRLANYAKTGKLERLRNGLYAKSNASLFEAAGKLYVPSYISLETVLTKVGIIFQHTETVFAVSYISREITLPNGIIHYFRMKDSVLFNTQGITQSANYAIATPERAFLDAVWIYKDYHFDNLSLLNWDAVWELLPIYESPTMVRRVKRHYKERGSHA